MDPLQVPGVETPVRRSPSPIIPGAWPLTPPTFKAPSYTPLAYRGDVSKAQFNAPLSSSNIAGSTARALHGSGAIISGPPYEASDSSPTIFNSSTFDSIPSESSQATRLTRETLVSTSTSSNISFDTFNALASTPERSSMSKISTQVSESKASFVPSDKSYLGAIPDMYPSRPQLVFHTPLLVSTPREEGPLARQTGRPLYPRLDIPRNNPPDDLGPSTDSAGPNAEGGEVPLSPILFASPTSSQGFPLFSDHGQNSYDYSTSPSWDTSYESEYNSQNRHPSSRPHSSLAPTPNRLPTSDARGQSPDVHILSDQTPSIDIGLHDLQMLTTLSLPSSGYDSSARETGNNAEPSRFLDNDTPWTLSLSPELTPSFNSIEHTSPMSRSLSLSPTSSFGAEIGLGPGEPRFITFPSSLFVSELPSPTYGYAGFQNDRPNHLNAADYSEVFMSSTWNTGEERMPESEVLEMHRDSADLDSAASVEACASSGDPPEYVHVYETTKLAAVMGKVKRLGGKVKKLLTPRLGAGRKVQKASGIGYKLSTFANGLPTTGEDPGHAIPRPNSSLGMNDHAPTLLPLPPGLLFQQPNLTTQTYAQTLATPSQNDNQNSAAGIPLVPPTIHICPPSSPEPLKCSSKPRPRPKTLAEIKSKRPLSLSALSNLPCPSSSAPRAIAISRPRPRSSIISPTSDLSVEERALFLNSVQRANQMPELAAAPANTLPAVPVLRSAPQTENSFLPAPNFKKNRRFSLASLSNFISSR